MYFRWKIFICLIPLMAFVLLSSLGPGKGKKAGEEAMKNLEEFSEQATGLSRIAAEYKLNRASVAKLRKAVAATRNAYKKTEYILSYYYPEYVEEHLNGAPLLHLSRENTRSSVVPPEGMQCLDELIFSDDPYAERVRIAELAQKLAVNLQVLQKGTQLKEFTEADVINAIRLQLVRIYTLGLTGFDTPGSVNAIREAEISMASLHRAGESLTENASPALRESINSLFEQGLQFLNANDDFNSFNRLAFLKEYIDPLYYEFLKLSKELKTGPSDAPVTAWNPASESIFAEDFLNPYFFTELQENEDSPQLRKLGKKLFYDKKLSGNNQMSCGSCHRPEMAFTDGVARSASSVVEKTVERNAPTLLNAVYSDRYFYDLRAFTLEQQAEHVVFNSLEFNTAYEQILHKLNADKEYRDLFSGIFKGKEITRTEFAKALSSYVLSLQSFNSPFDGYVRGEAKELDPRIREGHNIFMGKGACGTCHFAPLFSGLVPPLYVKNESEILGVLKAVNAAHPEIDEDKGRIGNGISTESNWIYEKSFKTSTVRNVEFTAPYFHNGAYETLEEVVDFYDHGGGAGLGLEVTNQTLPEDSLMLTASEKQSLILFMKALSDTSLARY